MLHFSMGIDRLEHAVTNAGKTCINKSGGYIFLNKFLGSEPNLFGPLVPCSRQSSNSNQSHPAIGTRIIS